jgi:hypothetical protein
MEARRINCRATKGATTTYNREGAILSYLIHCFSFRSVSLSLSVAQSRRSRRPCLTTDPTSSPIPARYNTM